MSLSPIKQSFSIRIENKYPEAKNVALFAGSIDTMGLAKDTEGQLHFTVANPEPVQNYVQGKIDAIMTDGVLPVMQDGTLTIPDTKGDTDFLRAKSLNDQFRIRDLLSYLKANVYLIDMITIKVQSQDQFDNPIIFKTTSPVQSLSTTSINPTKYSSPNMLQTTKIEIKDLKGTRIQEDTFMSWLINAGEIVNITFDFTEDQSL